MQVPVFALNPPSTALTLLRYTALAAGLAITGYKATSPSNANGVRTPQPVPGTVKNLEVYYQTAVTTAGSWVTRIQKNAVDQALVASVSSGSPLGGKRGSNTADSFHVDAGEDISIEYEPISSPDAQIINNGPAVAFIFESDNPGEAPLYGGNGSSTINVNAFLGFGGAEPSVTETDVQCPVPTETTLDYLYIMLGVAPGTGNSWTFTLRKNGADTGVTVTISDANVTGNSVATGVAVALSPTGNGGNPDLISLGMTWAGGTIVATNVQFALRQRPAIDGEGIHFGIASGTPSATAERWININGIATSGASAEVMVPSIAPLADIQMKKLTARFNVAPGAGKNRTVRLRANTVTQAPSVTIAETATNGRDATNVYTTVVGDILNHSTVPSAGSPTAPGAIVVGIVSYIPVGSVANLLMGARALDAGLSSFNSEATHIYVCNTQPTTYAEATTTYALGFKSMAAGSLFGAPTAAAAPAGRKVTSASVSGGTITTAGTVGAWAVVGGGSFHASGLLSGGSEVAVGQGFDLTPITIRMPK